jgi:Na+/proline symporter
VPHVYGIVFTLFAMFYSIIGGMHSIVLGDMIKYGIMTVACVWISFIAAGKLHGNHLNVPDGWYSPFFGKNLGLSWTGIISEVNSKIKADGYSLFGLFFMMMTFKGFFSAVAGPAPNYDMQKILSTRSPEEASKMSGFVNIILLPIRYALIISLTILGVLFYHQMDLKDAQGTIDFERILPAVINSFLPVGLVGLLLAGLLGAFMSTFSGTMNAAQAYIVNDIYLKYINPKASTKKIITANYLVGVFVVAVGVILGFFVKDVNSVLQWIVSALYGGYIASNVLKWHWWRFNANGFCYGMLSGILSAMIFSAIIPSVELLYWFPVLFAISLAGSVIGSYATAPTDIVVLKSFYTTVRPWGFWGPVKAIVMEGDPSFVPNKNFKLNMFNVVIGTITQCSLTILPMYLILAQKTSLIVTIAILVVTITILKKTWWDKLKDY